MEDLLPITESDSDSDSDYIYKPKSDLEIVCSFLCKKLSDLDYRKNDEKGKFYYKYVKSCCEDYFQHQNLEGEDTEAFSFERQKVILKVLVKYLGVDLEEMRSLMLYFFKLNCHCMLINGLTFNEEGRKIYDSARKWLPVLPMNDKYSDEYDFGHLILDCHIRKRWYYGLSPTEGLKRLRKLFNEDEHYDVDLAFIYGMFGCLDRYFLMKKYNGITLKFRFDCF